jgi:hypothetical protein
MFQTFDKFLNKMHKEMKMKIVISGRETHKEKWVFLDQVATSSHLVKMDLAFELLALN